ncbi:MAG: hypothetical protein HYX51_08485 [Chloroflexi bacterium]|nr:hypothetical protein [Chloroflexota bacterium]
MRLSRIPWFIASAVAIVLAGVVVAMGYSPRRPQPAAPVQPVATDAPARARASAQVTPPPARPNVRVRDPRFDALPGATARFGLYPGGAYRIEVPGNWNGGLVMYAHGYRGEGPDVYVSDPPLRRYLIANGWAWAASSYRGNGYRPDWGVEDTLALRDLFGGMYTQPTITLIEGSSMGGHVLVSSMELYPDVYQGALAECGVMTGIGEIDFLAAYTSAAEYISGVPLLDAPTANEFTRLVQTDWLREMGSPGAYTDKGRQFDSVVKYLMGGDLPLRIQGLAARYTANLLLVADPNSPSPAARSVSTTGTRFRIDPGLGLDEQQLNANIRRIAPAPGARTPRENAVFAEVTGAIRAPILSLHTTGDAYVPFSVEQDYRRITRAAGTDNLLVQRAIRRPGHCEFTAPELTRAFDDLVAWVERGEKPEGDDVLAPDLSSIGLRWTTPLHPEDPARR